MGVSGHDRSELAAPRATSTRDDDASSRNKLPRLSHHGSDVTAARSLSVREDASQSKKIVTSRYKSLAKITLQSMLNDWIQFDLQMGRYTFDTPKSVKTKIKRICCFAINTCATREQKEMLTHPIPGVLSPQDALTAWGIVFKKTIVDISSATEERIHNLEVMHQKSLPNYKTLKDNRKPCYGVCSLAKRVGSLATLVIDMEHKFTVEGTAVVEIPVAYSREKRERDEYLKHVEVYDRWKTLFMNAA
jgi:hypothetical protein